jgi:hypothetical protein
MFTMTSNGSPARRTTSAARSVPEAWPAAVIMASAPNKPHASTMRWSSVATITRDNRFDA